ncbi:MAG: TonB-dependent receptor [Desulfovibrionaceae bacterium]
MIPMTIPLFLHAAELEDVQLEKVVVTARGIGAEVSRTPGGVGVVTLDEVRATSPIGVADAAARIPGVDISTDSPWGADVVIRGMARDSVVFLIDGCRMNVTTDINGRFGLINPQDIERIEVLKGPISTLYGSGSTGGVVNVITRQGHFSEEPELHGEVMAAYATNPAGPDTYANLTYSSPSFWLWGSGGWREHGSYYDGGDNVVSNSQFQDFTGKLAGAYAWDSENVTTLQYQSVDGNNVGIPGTGSAPLPTTADVSLKENDRRFFQASHSYTPEGSVLRESTLTFSYQLLQRNPRIDNFTAGPMNWIEPTADHETYAGNWKNVLDLDDHVVVVGLDAWNWNMISSRRRVTLGGAVLDDKPTPDTDQFSGGLFAEDNWQINDAWALNFGGRLDGVLISNEETATVDAGYKNNLDWGGHVGLTWAFAQGWTATGLLGASYRTPNILELFKNINLGGGQSEIGNPGLRAERSRFMEVGLHRTQGELQGSLSIFHNRVDDMITSSTVSPTVFQMANIAEAQLTGGELALQWYPIDGWQVYADAAYTEGRNETTGEWLRFVAPLNGMIGVRNDLESGFWWAVESEWAAEQHQVPEDALTTDSWAILNARCGYAFEFQELNNELILEAKNIFNTQYRNHLATSRGIELRNPGIDLNASWRVSF